MSEIVKITIDLFTSDLYVGARYAIIVGALVSLCASLLGVTLVLRRFSFIGDGLSHVAFGAMAIAAIARLSNNLLIVLPITIIAAIVLLGTGQNKKIKGDAAIAMVSVGALATGYMLLNLFSTSSNVAGDVCSSLFGSTSILTLGGFDVLLSIALCLLVILFFVFFYNKIFAITFDESFAKATGTRTSLYNLLFASVIAIVIVLSMNLVGSLLVSALIVFPTLCAMRVCNNFRSVTICAAVVSVSATVLGIYVSVISGTPVGSTVVVADILMFVIFSVLGVFIGRRRA